MLRGYVEFIINAVKTTRATKSVAQGVGKSELLAVPCNLDEGVSDRRVRPNGVGRHA